MLMDFVLWGFIIVLLILLIILLLRQKGVIQKVIQPILEEHIHLRTEIVQLDARIKSDFTATRLENAENASTGRKEMANALHLMSNQHQQSIVGMQQLMNDKIEVMLQKLDDIHRNNRHEMSVGLKLFSEEQTGRLQEMKQEQKDYLQKIILTVKEFSDTFDKNVQSFNNLQREQFNRLDEKQEKLVQQTQQKLESIRVTVEEKLEKTLSERLGQSFETVGKQLLEVQKGLGEMQTIATDVGGLKKVLSNVKLRGGIGEVQLAMLLEQTLAPNQYEANVVTRKHGSEPVEFAIKLPGKSDDEKDFVYLPVDAKFPKDVFEKLQDAYESAHPDEIEIAAKQLEQTIRKMAKDIRDKYIHPPYTTDFAIMFLPFESIFAEVIRRSSLVDTLRDEFKIVIAGPTTLMALLNSFQMGFRTLALQKRSSEVWGVLSKVKSEFEKFGGLLDKAQRNIQTGLNQLDDVVGTRTRAIQRQLREVETLPDIQSENQKIDWQDDEVFEQEQ